MSITVADVLKLPSMRGAKVLGGEKGLSRIVSSISVLEYAQINTMQTELLENIEFMGNELAITGFMNNPDDVELQCTNIRRMSAIGEVGLILFYVGVVMKKVDQRLIDVANELDFALISLPEGQMNQRYSEVICEVMELIHRDQMSSTSIVSELLEQASGLPAYQRTVDNMLRMLANRIRASVVLMDSSRRVLNEAAWPTALSSDMKHDLTIAEFPEKDSWLWHEALGINIYRDGIQTRENHSMDMLIFKEGPPLDVVFTRQAVELVQLAVSIWSDKHDSIVVGELVRAILQDEPMKMRRLADIFHVDIASINSMWLISAENEDGRNRLRNIVDDIRRAALTVSAATIADIYDEVLVLFMIGPGSIQDIRLLTEAIELELSEHEILATLTRGHALNTTTRVREAFLCHQACLSTAIKIFPGQKVFNLEWLYFAQQCQELVGRGERAVEEARRCLGAIETEGTEANLLETLECYLLDAKMSVIRASDKMFLHKNTIKYRIQRIADHLGFVPGEFPDTMPLYTACALNRLLRQK